MKIKICGMKNRKNIQNAGKLPVDFMGFIFYPPSPRFAGNVLTADDLSSLPAHIRKVGVFVSVSAEILSAYLEAYPLDWVQLHGAETPEFCRTLKKDRPQTGIIKAFPVSEVSDFNQMKEYEEGCDYFLFDTKTEKYGGSGKKFDWSLLNGYSGKTPFFLSGGISPSDAEKIKQISHSSFYGVDLNSKFETKTGIKDLNLLQTFINDLQL